MASFLGSMRLSSVRATNSASINDITALSISLSETPPPFAKSPTDFLPSTNCLKIATAVGFVKILARFAISASGALEPV